MDGHIGYDRGATRFSRLQRRADRSPASGWVDDRNPPSGTIALLRNGTAFGQDTGSEDGADYGQPGIGSRANQPSRNARSKYSVNGLMK